MAASIITRAEARAQGLKRYFTAQPCKRGHVAERQVSNLTCMECGREKMRAQCLLRDKGAERERLRKWKDENRAKVRASAHKRNQRPDVKAAKAQWFQANKARILQARRDDAAKREAHRSSTRAWIKANPEKAREHGRLHASRRRARKRGADGHHTKADLAEVFQAQGGRCAYCKVNLNRKKKQVDHIVPLARGGSNARANIQYLCAPCNQTKNARDPIEFAQPLGLLL